MRYKNNDDDDDDNIRTKSHFTISRTRYAQVSIYHTDATYELAQLLYRTLIMSERFS